MKAICPVCGKEFDDAKEHGGRPRRYCSPRCRNIINLRNSYARRKARKQPTRKTPTRPVCGDKPRTCPVCGKEFMPNPSRPQKQYCSSHCGSIGIKRQKRGVPVSEEAFRAYQKDCAAKREAERRTVKCAFCGKVFVPPSNHPNVRYCSIACSNRARGAERRSGRNVSSGNARNAAPNITFVQKLETQERGSVARVEAYLRLPASERYAQRDTLTKKEQAMARDLWLKIKCQRPVYHSAMAY